MSKGIFIIKNEGQLIPDTLLEKVVADYTSAWSVTGVVEGHIKVFKHLAAPTLAAVKECQESVKDSTLMFCFHSFEAGSTEESIQPHTLADDILVMAMDGDFSGYEEEGSSLDPSVHAAGLIQENLIPLYTAFNGDMEKMLEHLHSTGFAKTLVHLSTEQSAYCIVSNTGEFLVRKNRPEEVFGSFDWGLVSHKHGYFEGSAKKVEATASSNPFAAAMQKGKAAVTKLTSGGGKTNNTGPIIADTNKTATEKKEDLKSGVSTGAMDTPVYAKPPETWLVGQQDKLIKDFYRSFSEDKSVPPKWTTLPWILVRKSALRNFYQEMIKGVKFQHKPALDASGAPIPLSATEPQVLPKDKPIQVPSSRPDPVVPGAVPQAQIDEFGKEILPKLMTVTKQAGGDPMKLIAAESKQKTFCEQTGIVDLHAAAMLPRWVHAQMYDFKERDLLLTLINDVSRGYLEMYALAEQTTNPTSKPAVIAPPEPAKSVPEVKQTSGNNPFAAAMQKKSKAA